MRKFCVVLAGAGMTVSLAACGNGPPPSELPSSAAGGTGAAAGTKIDPAPAGADVTIEAGGDNKFHAPVVSAGVGQVVEWVNSGAVSHNITFEDPNAALTQPAFDAGAKYAVKWTKAGTYKYQCTIHPGMAGEVDVK